MTSRKQWLKEIASLCAEVRPEDGTDPRKLSDKQTRKQAHRKTYQVCKQAEKTLNLVLAGESVEPLLHELIISAVEPAPDSSHLLVIVEPNSTTISLDESEVLAALQRAVGRLRSAIATTINRKRVPQLSFRFIAATGVAQ
ncbi:MAG: ribosome-binding factor A [Candidatus Parabeggiatoa sp. nov. 1]|nr:MAG: ribosome-binding factor A [Gammaproteobacteria bacterium]